MSMYPNSDWSIKPYHDDGFRKDCKCHDHKHKGCSCLGYGNDGCKCNKHKHNGCKCHGHDGGCHQYGHHGHGCQCGGKGHYDDHHHGRHCKCCHHGSCRRFLCDDDFRLRLGGLQNGLNFRLRQLIGCYAEFTLENDQVVHGKICHVGSNFVEMMVYQPVPYPEDTPKDAAEDKQTELKPAEYPGTKEKVQYPKKENHTMIFSLEKINHLKHHCGCPGPCGCK